MKKILILLLTCACIYSCSKDDASFNSKEAYKVTGNVIADEPVMYTNNGVVIHDQAIIKDYVTRRGVLSDYAFSTTGDASKFSSYTLEFKDSAHALLGKTTFEITEKNDTALLMASLDASSTPAGEKSWSDSLMDMVNKNGPLAECPSYYTKPCAYRAKYPLQIIKGSYYIPYVVATVSTTVMIPTSFGVPMDYTVFTHKSGESMIFNSSVITKLGRELEYPSGNLNYILQSNDTLVIQTLRQQLIKQ